MYSNGCMMVDELIDVLQGMLAMVIDACMVVFGGHYMIDIGLK